MSSHRVLFLLTCALIVLQFAQKSDASLRLCGSKLTIALKAICHNQICGGFYYKKKRSPMNDVAPIEVKEAYTSKGSVSSNSFVQTYENVPVKPDEGIATMCCKRKCTLEYLQTYCCTQFVLPQN
ncbi:CRE-INS-1 protein [Aphelenchoides besseyi]|nr:CRE-INS-1 protein [Aphelenchoides besseyi]